ncbi:hypothetical protein Pelo_9331 [Pelomyxa schiedti]|nr:hypothetical protein Pelo_9331 [Pelomyxa schiedti]
MKCCYHVIMFIEERALTHLQHPQVYSYEREDRRSHITILPHHNLTHCDRVLEDNHTLEHYRVFHRDTLLLKFTSHVGQVIDKAMCPIRTKGQNYIHICIPPEYVNKVLLSCYNVYKILSIESTTVLAVRHMEVLNYHDYHNDFLCQHTLT